MLDAVDAVYVCTWTSEHPRLVAAAVERGLPVFCEKPLATIARRRARRWPTAVDGGRRREPGRAGAAQQPGLPRAASTRSRIRAAAGSRPRCCATTSSSRCRACTAPPGGPIRPRPARARCSSTRSTTSTRSSGCSARSCRSARGRAPSTATPGSRTRWWSGMELAGGAQVSLTSVWHQLLERPSLRRLEVICEHAFLTLEHDVIGPGHVDPPGGAGLARGRRAVQRRRRAPRRPLAEPGRRLRRGGRRPASPARTPTSRPRSRAHVVVDGDLPLGGRRRRAGRRQPG